MDSIDEVMVANPNELDSTEARIKQAGRRALAEQNRDRQRLIDKGRELILKTEVKASVRQSEAESEVVHKTLHPRRLSKWKERDLANEDVRDMRRLVDGNVEDSVANFIGNKMANKKKHEAEIEAASDERRAKKEEKYDMKWDPGGRGEREDKQKASIKFLGQMAKENQQKKDWGLPYLHKLDMGMMEAEAHPKHAQELLDNVNKHDNSLDFTKMSRDAYAQVSVLRERAKQAEQKMEIASAKITGLHNKLDAAARLRLKNCKLAVTARLQAKQWLEDKMQQDALQDQRKAIFENKLYTYITRPDTNPIMTHLPNTYRIAANDPVLEKSIFRDNGDADDLLFLNKLEMEERNDNGEPPGPSIEVFSIDPGLDAVLSVPGEDATEELRESPTVTG